MAYRFHKHLDERLGGSKDLQFSAPSSRISAVYETLIRPRPSLCRAFLLGLTKPFASALTSDPASAEIDTGFLSFLASVIAHLPLQTGDELRTVLGSVDTILSRRADGLLSSLKCLLESTEIDQVSRLFRRAVFQKSSQIVSQPTRDEGRNQGDVRLEDKREDARRLCRQAAVLELLMAVRNFMKVRVDRVPTARAATFISFRRSTHGATRNWRIRSRMKRLCGKMRRCFAAAKNRFRFRRRIRKARTCSMLNV